MKKQVCSLRQELKSMIDETCCKHNIEAKTYHEKIVEIINNLDKYEQKLKRIRNIITNELEELIPYVVSVKTEVAQDRIFKIIQIIDKVE